MKLPGIGIDIRQRGAVDAQGLDDLAQSFDDGVVDAVDGPIDEARRHVGQQTLEQQHGVDGR